MNYKEKLSQIKAFVFDVDGVLGSDRVLLNPDGELLRTMNIKDGYSMVYAMRKGFRFAIITGGTNDSIIKRFTSLGVQDIYLKSSNKMHDYLDFLAKYNLTDHDILYMGDDLPDLEVMQKVAIASCPSTAVDEIKEIAHYISPIAGGEGAVRDVIQQVLKSQGRWLEPDAFKW